MSMSSIEALASAWARIAEEKPMGLITEDDGWRIPDALWEKMKRLLPVHVPRPHPLECHRRRVEDPAAR